MAKTLPNKNNKGFALIAAVGLLAFVTLLVISLTTLLRVEVGTEISAREFREARGNAEMAMGIAMGELLNLAGDDRRITATAAILDRNPATESIDGVNHPYWTGVWKSWAQQLDGNGPRENIYYESSDNPSTPPWDYKKEHDNRFEGWLVSLDTDRTRGKTGESLLNLPITLGRNDSNFIELVGTGTLGTRADDELKVKAEKIKVYRTDNRSNAILSGHYAWWVGDEGVKAPMNTSWVGEDTKIRDDNASLQDYMTAAPKVGLGAISAVQNLQNQSSDTLKKLFSRSSLELFSGNINNAKLLFHDITPFSYGVIANVRNGGLRKDLNLFLELEPSDVDSALMCKREITVTKNKSKENFRISGEDFFEGIEPDGIIKASSYDAQGDEGGGVNPKTYNKLAFTPWGFIHQYYQLYKEVKFERGLPMFQMQALKGKNNQRNRVVIPQAASRAYLPIISKSQRIYSYYLQGERMYMVMDLIVTLWNPYNVAFDGRSQYFFFKNYDIPVKFGFSINGGTAKEENRMFNELLMRSPPIMEVGYLRPGETKVYSTKKVEISGDLSKIQLLFGTGWQRGGGMHLPLNNITVPAGQTVRVSCWASPGDGWWSLALNFPCWIRDDIADGAGGSAENDRDWGRLGMYMRIRFMMKEGTRNDMSIIYPNITKPTYSYGELQGSSRAVPIFVHNVALKTARGFKRTPYGRHMEFNDITFGFGNGYVNVEKSQQNYQYELEMRNISSWEDTPLVEVSSPEGDGNALGKGNNGYIGGGQDAAYGQAFYTYSELPFQPLISLPQLRNCQFLRAEYDWDMIQYVAEGLSGVGNDADVVSTDNLMNFPIAMFLVGNSQAHPYIKASSLKTESGNTEKKDYRYYANHILWDNYYFSALTPQESVFFDKKRSINRVVDDFFDSKEALANARLMPYVTEHLNKGRIDPSNRDAYRQVAQWQMINGAFNINSTSVNAWKALLGSLGGQMIPVVDATKTTPTIRHETPSGYPFSRLSIPSGESADDSGDRDLYWRGYRNLTSSQITELAERIVEEVKKRGPFLSLGEFVNRQVTNGDKDLALNGAIQAAIDATRSINNQISKTGRAANWKDVEFAEASEGRTTSGATGWLMQADVLQPIAPVISARSDTFVIRCYGDSVDAEGNVKARAWAEAVVQRVPELFDTGVTLPENAPRVNNRLSSYKRAFKVISFRWLSPDEI